VLCVPMWLSMAAQPCGEGLRQAYARARKIYQPEAHWCMLLRACSFSHLAGCAHAFIFHVHMPFRGCHPPSAASLQTFFFAGRICDDRRPPNITRAWPKNCGPRNPGRPTISFYSGGVRARVRSAGYAKEECFQNYLHYTTHCIAPTQLFDATSKQRLLNSFILAPACMHGLMQLRQLSHPAGTQPSPQSLWLCCIWSHIQLCSRHQVIP